MSEIPIGSPPAPPGRHAAPPGWYADPVDRAQERYWDGWQWSRTTRSAENAAAAGHPSAPMPGAMTPNGHAPTTRSGGWGAPTSGQAPGPRVGSAGPGGGFATSAPGTQAMLTADGVPMAAWGFRAIAAVFDLILTGLVATAFATPFYRPMWNAVMANVQQSVAATQRGEAPLPSPTVAELMALMTSTDRVMIGVIAAVVGIGYFALMWRFRSATLGQLIFGLRVVPVDQAQQTPRISWSAAVIRAIVWVVPRLSAYLVLFWVLNCLFPLWNGKRQALHDLAARTQVVRIR